VCEQLRDLSGHHRQPNQFKERNFWLITELIDQGGVQNYFGVA
jgi:hypothetical protein